jgi:hypothetical protein
MVDKRETAGAGQEIGLDGSHIFKGLLVSFMRFVTLSLRQRSSLTLPG